MENVYPNAVTPLSSQPACPAATEKRLAPHPGVQEVSLRHFSHVRISRRHVFSYSKFHFPIFILDVYTDVKSTYDMKNTHWLIMYSFLIVCAY